MSSNRILLLTIVAFTGCVERPRQVSIELQVPTLEADDVARPVVPDPPPVAFVPPAPAVEVVYVEPLPSPIRHTVRTRTVPPQATTLGEVQSVEVELELEGGPAGAREVGVVFVAPAGFSWERQVATVDRTADGAPQTVRFSLPVAATLIADQGLSGTWNLTTLDEGVEQAATTFVLNP